MSGSSDALFLGGGGGGGSVLRGGRKVGRSSVCSRFILITGAVFFFFLLIWMSDKQLRQIKRLSGEIGSENHVVKQLQEVAENYESEQHKKTLVLKPRVDGNRKENRPAQQANTRRIDAGKLWGRDDRVREVAVQDRGHSSASLPIAAVVIMACNRPDYLERTVKSLLMHHTSPEKFPLYISQDGLHEGVHNMAIRYGPRFSYIQHIEERPPAMKSPTEMIAYYRIAEHYKFALGHLFDVKGYPRVIMLEDDMDISPDFFSYFEATAPLLDQDSSILAISSWNDNGQSHLVGDAEALYRSDFFPGLGWMMNRQLWEELRPKWPAAYWDDWLRSPQNRKGRQSIRPEVCRTYNFGEQGSSHGQYFAKYLQSIKMNDKDIDWSTKDLSYLLKDQYPEHFMNLLNSAKPISAAQLLEGHGDNLETDVRLVYDDQASYAAIVRPYGVFEDWKDGIPRVSYEGVVVFRLGGGKNVFLLSASSVSNIQARIAAARGGVQAQQMMK
ncbi:hypothetical protein CBR_g40811 [Chara braunii]|uniref:Alpha-1,3-mannosyl-glycoprotein 2-beta-N-acetylglucosaminyltransferase n=1 Tax=Chara braunii TaxID=69332 RepID=A0A388LUK1_CHABU|nr:hypothetical protein CBR_g40811 [Chara braunii]|eukprot:GBG85998.1 hypothetical protein CBR_g40811 [Chara braunii]